MILFVQHATFFTKTVPIWQRRYDALRACFVDRPSAQLEAARMITDALYRRLAWNLRSQLL
jgi:hypothetical protein